MECLRGKTRLIIYTLSVCRKGKTQNMSEWGDLILNWGFSGICALISRASSSLISNSGFGWRRKYFLLISTCNTAYIMEAKMFLVHLLENLY